MVYYSQADISTGKTVGTGRTGRPIPYMKAMSRAARLDHIMRWVSHMTNIKIAPSILAADFTRLDDEIERVLKAGADYIHIDVMDGQFVPNISMGVPVVESIHKTFPNAFLDVHLMIVNPSDYVEAFAKAGASHITVHLEADKPEDISLALEMARRCGVRTGLSVKPVAFIVISADGSVDLRPITVPAVPKSDVAAIIDGAPALIDKIKSLLPKKKKKEDDSDDAETEEPEVAADAADAGDETDTAEATAE